MSWYLLIYFLCYYLFSRSYNFSTKQLCRNNDYAVGKWKSIQKLEKSFYCCENEDVGIVASCGSQKVVVDGYLESSELFIASQSACTCDSVQNTRRTVNPREKYEWVPDSCRLEPFRGDHFCHLLGRRRIILIGDSLIHQVATVLVNILYSHNASCINHIAHGKTVIGRRGDKDSFYHFFKLNNGADICIVNAGAHLHDDGDMNTVWDSLPKWRHELQGLFGNGSKFVWMSQLYGHMDCFDVKEPLEEFTPIMPQNYSDDVYNWRYFPKYDSMGRDYAEMNNFAVINMSMTRLRPDAHRGHSLKGKPDCLHFCIPGPLDVFPTILYNKLIVGEI